jgi:hypothetical protein
MLMQEDNATLCSFGEDNATLCSFGEDNATLSSFGTTSFTSLLVNVLSWRWLLGRTSTSQVCFMSGVGVHVSASCAN